MAAPNLLAADFLGAIQKLLPRGRVWPRDQNSVQAQALAGLAPSYARNTARANYLLVDAFPGTTYELLPEWELSLGLPDPCAGDQPTIRARRNQVVARLANGGGQSVPYFIGAALNLGYSVTVTQYAPARIGQSRVGEPLCGTDWAFAWQINSPLNTVLRSRVGSSTVGEPLASWSNSVLECELNALKPAHTTLIFSYT